MKLHNKGAQTITLDFIIGITIFLSMIVLFYYFFAVDVTKTEEETEAAAVINGLSGFSFEADINADGVDETIYPFEDGELTDDEIEALSELDCKKLKEFFNTNKNVCLYATDTNGNLVPLNEKIALGCEGIEIVDSTGQDTICGQE